jgi:molybdate transport system substrate-binding protein
MMLRPITFAAALASAIIALPALAAPPTVLAAASLTDAFTAVGDAWKAQGHEPPTFSFASSSALAQQIEAGAPAAIFASADERWMDELASEDLIVPGSRVSPIGNAVVLVAPADSALGPVTIDASLDLEALLGADGKIAVGDPDHVPVGRYAKESLETLGLWAAAEPRLARTDDVRAALALVETGEVPAGIVYATDAAISDKVKLLGTFPAESHTPVTYPFALIKGADDADATAFFTFLTSDEGLAIIETYGFVPLAK